MFDDGVSLLNENKYQYIEMAYAENKLTFNVVNGQHFKYPGTDGMLGEVKVYGVAQKVSKVMLEKKGSNSPIELKFSQDGKVVTVETGEVDVSYVEISSIELVA